MIRSTRLKLCAPSRNAALCRLPAPRRRRPWFWPRARGYPISASWSARRRRRSRGDWRGRSRSSRACNNDCRRAAEFSSWANWRGWRAAGGAGSARPPPAGALGRPQHGGDEAAGAVKHEDRLKAVFVMMGVEEGSCWPPWTASKVSSMSMSKRPEARRRPRR
jgi:hypothetical protein